MVYGEENQNGDYGIVARVEINGDTLNTYNNFKDNKGKRNNFKVKPFDWEYYDFGNGKGDPMVFADNTGGIFAHNGKEHMLYSDNTTSLSQWSMADLDDPHAHPMSQAEDRLTTTAEQIPNASKYIIRIDIYCDAWLTNEDITTVQNKLVEIYEMANKNNLPVYFYDDINNFSLQNGKYTMDVKQYINRLFMR